MLVPYKVVVWKLELASGEGLGRPERTQPFFEQRQPASVLEIPKGQAAKMMRQLPGARARAVQHATDRRVDQRGIRLHAVGVVGLIGLPQAPPEHGSGRTTHHRWPVKVASKVFEQSNERAVATADNEREVA